METSEHMSDNAFQEIAAPRRGQTAPLPLEYGHPFVTLLPRDPRCVFAQWELPGATEGSPVLRLYDLTGARTADSEDFTRQFVDFEGVPARHGMYIRMEAPGRSVVARIGFRQPEMTAGDDVKMATGDGGKTAAENGRQMRSPVHSDPFQPVATSNVVHLPPGTAAGPGEDAFPWVSARPDIIFRASPDMGRFGVAAFGSTASSDFAVTRSRS